MDETLASAQKLLGTLQAGQLALLQLATQHLPFPRLVELCEVHSDPDGASLSQVSKMVDTRLNLMRLSIYGAMGTQVPEARDSAGSTSDPGVMAWMEQVARESGERAGREAAERSAREAGERSARREREVNARLDGEKSGREDALRVAQEALAAVQELSTRQAEESAAQRARMEAAELRATGAEEKLRSLEALRKMEAEAELQAREEVERRAEAAEALAASARDAESQARQEAMAHAAVAAQAREAAEKAEAQRQAALLRQQEAEQLALDAMTRQEEAQKQAQADQQSQAAAMAARKEADAALEAAEAARLAEEALAAKAAQAEAQAKAEKEAAEAAAEEARRAAAKKAEAEAEALAAEAARQAEEEEEAQRRAVEMEEARRLAELARSNEGNRPARPVARLNRRKEEVPRLEVPTLSLLPQPPSIGLEDGFPDLEAVDEKLPATPAAPPVLGFPNLEPALEEAAPLLEESALSPLMDEDATLSLIPGSSARPVPDPDDITAPALDLAALTNDPRLSLPEDEEDEDAPTNPPSMQEESPTEVQLETVEPRARIRIPDELDGLRPGIAPPPSLASEEDDEGQATARLPRMMPVSRGGDPDSDSNPGRVLLREDRAPAVHARTTRIAAPRPAGAPPEEVIITGEGGDSDAESGVLRVKLEAPVDVRIPELTDDNEPLSERLVVAPSVTVTVDTSLVSQLLASAKASYEKGDLQKSIQLLTDALDMRPDLAETYINRGQCHLDLGDYSSAMSDFQRAEDLEPNKPEPHFAMGNLYFNRKEYKRAIEFYDQALEMNGQHAMARCRRGISYYYRKNYRQAYADLQAAFRLDPDIPNIRKYVQMAMKKMDKGD